VFKNILGKMIFSIRPNTVSPETVQAVWNKATIVPGYNAALIRKDRCGAWIKRNDHGLRNSSYGWEVHHITPIAIGGSDTLSNLMPLHWQNNLETSNSRVIKCPVVAVS
jgi:5-methylcytosine-specific restriction endonuclease McrA